ncbi:MAG TPA: hypothetical protein VIT23_14735, partial [Terrimicrobiaceae bacterium]
VDRVPGQMVGNAALPVRQVERSVVGLAHVCVSRMTLSRADGKHYRGALHQKIGRTIGGLEDSFKIVSSCFLVSPTSQLGIERRFVGEAP